MKRETEPQLGIWLWCGSCHRCYRRGEELEGRCAYRDCRADADEAKPWRGVQMLFAEWPVEPIPGASYSPPGQPPLSGPDAPEFQPWSKATGAPIREGQRGQILRLIEKAGISEAEFAHQAGKPLDDLTQREAKRWIAELTTQTKGKPDQAKLKQQQNQRKQGN